MTVVLYCILLHCIVYIFSMDHRGKKNVMQPYTGFELGTFRLLFSGLAH